MSASLVESFATDFDPEEFSDEYQDELKILIDAKLEKGDALDTSETFGDHEEEDSGGEVIDLMAALRASVEKSRAAREGKGGSSDAASSTSSKSSASSSSSKPAAKKSTSTSSSKTADKAAPKKKPAAKKTAKAS